MPRPVNSNTNLDDICSVVGYTPTNVIAAWFPRRMLYVPRTPTPGHPLETLLGGSVLRRLCRAFGGQQLWIPGDSDTQRMHRDREIAHAFASGASDDELADRHGVTRERIQQLRRAMSANGMIDYLKLENFKSG